tara:strand:+ start:414 stop:830 length:417 start_codon:yes stop_codon:yes gene_type:complete
MNYIESMNINNNENKKRKEKNFKNTKDLLNKGYSIIKKDEKTQKIIVIESNKTKELKKKFEKENYNRKFLNMIENWNNFRDTDIELRGDMSIYYNYKEELEKIIIEDIEIECMLNEKFNDNKYCDYSSDEENNKYLLY